ncbi:hypothetical protein DM860_007135 [Cuscuta australis]|uniref:Glycosyltransferases n=1 Tax=Cuscuta australis TaxID=267555 RepID=A0A328EA74_9ASTE|nr:hypothetical protein DM860_007135 [Cuscuta australis]
MASIRRTLSPYHERHNPNGGNLFSISVQSQSQKPVSSGKVSSQSPSFGFRVFSSLCGFRHPRKMVSWRNSFSRCLVLFVLGFVLGVTMYGDLDDLNSKSFAWKMKPQVGNDRLERKGFVTARPSALVDRVQLQVEQKNVQLDLVLQKQLIVVTPTYNRALQAYYLNRLGQALKLVQPPLLWIVVEMNAASLETAEILRKIGVIYRHLVCFKNMTDIKDRGVHQRNYALEHIEQHRLDGIVYFADDDNIYSLELFESVRKISRFGTWPVAMLQQSKNKAILEGPVCNEGRVIGWHTNEKSKRLRRFHVDMSGFAFDSTILWDPKVWHRPTTSPIRQLDTVKEGFQETTFIEQLVEDESKMEGISSGCSSVLNWHLHLDASELVYPKGWLIQKNLGTVLRVK